MSRRTIREAIATYLEGSNITNLGKVYTQPPKLTPASDFYQGSDPGHGSGAVIYIHIPDQHESRIALGGPTNGNKLRPYTVGLVCVFRSTKPDVQEVGNDNDDFLDSLCTAIESNRNAGNAAVVWQWGEGEQLYGIDIRVKAEMPRPIRQQTSQVFSVVEVTVLEWLNT